MISILKGFLLGLIIVLPGMSGGTVFVILGMYESMIKDIVKYNIKPYLPLFLGVGIGIYVGGKAFAMFFISYRDITVALLLGALLASVRAVVDVKQKPNIKHIGAIFFGFLIGFLTSGESISMIPQSIEANKFTLLIGGALASAAMIIPGVPGSSVLFVLNIYDTMIMSIEQMHIVNLLIFGIGSLLGILLLANALEKIYDKYRDLLSYVFAGLIIGSARTLLPGEVDFMIVGVFIVAFLAVWRISKTELATN